MLKYKKVPVLEPCTTLLRRYHAKAVKSTDATLPQKGIAYCNKIFEIEEKLKNLSSEERRVQRLKQEIPVLEAFWAWVDANLEVA